jgi:predicted RNase H-like nuclease (RuvC/YqgF family)
MEEGTSSLPKPVKKDIIEVKSSKGHKYKEGLENLNFSIDLNRPASEEDQDEDRVETEDVPERQRSEEFKTVIEDLKQHNRRLEVWNAKLQEKVQKLKEKYKKNVIFQRKLERSMSNYIGPMLCSKPN